MIVKRLREKRNWSQEQLAQMAGVSLRTIQRVEAGNRASLETLKSLASVFDVEISTLTEEIIVIDKDSQSWKSEPILIRFFLMGIKKRSHYIAFEYLMLVAAVLSWILQPEAIITPLAFFLAYLHPKIITYVDKKGYW